MSRRTFTSNVPKSHHYRFKTCLTYPPVNYRYMSPMHRPSINYAKNNPYDTHCSSNIPVSTLTSPWNTRRRPVARWLTSAVAETEKWYIPEKVVCIPLLITAGKHSDYAPGAIPVKREHCSGQFHRFSCVSGQTAAARIAQGMRISDRPFYAGGVLWVVC